LIDQKSDEEPDETYVQYLTIERGTKNNNDDEKSDKSLEIGDIKFQLIREADQKAYDKRKKDYSLQAAKTRVE
jgi:hypothetical protein